MTRRFVILSTQRSGSNWMEDRLDSHPDIDVLRSEPFRQTSKRRDSYNEFCRAARSPRLVSWLCPPLAKWWFLRRSERSARGVFGFRLMYDQLRRNPVLFLWLVRPGTTVIHLVREDVLAAHVSSLKAQRSGVFVSRVVDHRPDKISVPLDDLQRSLRDRRNRQRRHRRLLRRGPIAGIEVVFEEYLASPDRTDRLVLSALDVDERPLDSALQRLSGRSLADDVENWTALQATLAGTEWEQLDCVSAPTDETRADGGAT